MNSDESDGILSGGIEALNEVQKIDEWLHKADGYGLHVPCSTEEASSEDECWMYGLRPADDYDRNRISMLVAPGSSKVTELENVIKDLEAEMKKEVEELNARINRLTLRISALERCPDRAQYEDLKIENDVLKNVIAELEAENLDVKADLYCLKACVREALDM